MTGRRKSIVLFEIGGKGKAHIFSENGRGRYFRTLRDWEAMDTCVFRVRICTVRCFKRLFVTLRDELFPKMEINTKSVEYIYIYIYVHIKRYYSFILIFKNNFYETERISKDNTFFAAFRTSNFNVITTELIKYYNIMPCIRSYNI